METQLVENEGRASVRLPMVSEWRHMIDVESHLDTIDVLVQRSIDMVNSSRLALAQLEDSRTTARERLAASWALLTKHADALAKKSTAPEKPTLPPSPQPHSRL